MAGERKKKQRRRYLASSLVGLVKLQIVQSGKGEAASCLHKLGSNHPLATQLVSAWLAADFKESTGVLHNLPAAPPKIAQSLQFAAAGCCKRAQAIPCVRRSKSARRESP
jgi:hypothetical protein